MKNILLTLILVVTSTYGLIGVAASAEWLFVSTTNTGKYYYDPTRTNRFGDKVETTILTNLYKDDLKTHSIITDVEYNCRLRTVTVMALMRYTGKNGGGKLQNVATYIENDWPRNQPVATDSKLFPIVCANYKSMKDNER